MNDYTGWAVSVGFLDGNLGDEACCAAAGDYADALEEKLREAFPGAMVVVKHQDAAGSPPSGYQPWVCSPRGDDHHPDMTDLIQRIADDVFASYVWLPRTGV